MNNEVKFDRFYVEEDQFPKYSELESDSNFFCNNHPELFLLSACIGYQYNLRQKIEKKVALTLKNSFINQDFANDLYAAFKIIAENQNEFDQDNNLKINTIIEEYANGGFNKLYNELLNGPGRNNDKFLNFLMLQL